MPGIHALRAKYAPKLFSKINTCSLLRTPGSHLPGCLFLFKIFLIQVPVVRFNPVGFLIPVVWGDFFTIECL